MTSRLLQANLNNSTCRCIDEIHALLADLRDAWVAIGDKPAAASTAAADTRPRSMASA